MGLYEDLIESVKSRKDEIIRDVRVGLGWTAVLTSNIGLSLTYSSPEDELEEGGSLKGKNAYKVLTYLKTFNLLKLSIGLATLNSLIDVPKDFETFNILDYMEETSKEKKVVFVGHFPGLDKIRSVAKELVILERNPKEGDLIDSACEYVMGDADIVAITGSAFANKTIERLLKLSRGYTILLGPSTPLSPVLFDYGVDLIGGSLILDKDKVLEAVSQGVKHGIVRNKKYLKPVALKRN